MRNSDPDAAVYWLARMLEAGEDPLYIARRVDPLRERGHRAGGFAARWKWQSRPIRRVTFMGMPECTVQSDAGGGVHGDGAEIERAVCGV